MPIRIPDSTGEHTTYVETGNIVAARGSKAGDAYFLEHGPVKFVTLDKTAAGLAADEGFLLVDLSDTTNFPHAETGKLRLYGYDLHVEGDTDATGTLYVGVITEVDATNGSTAWIKTHRVYTDTNGTDSTKHYDFIVRVPGLDLEVDAVNDVLYNGLSNTGHSGDTTWQTDVVLDSPRGDTTVAPQDGDLVLYLDRVAGNFYFSITVYYDAEEA